MKSTFTKTWNVTATFRTGTVEYTFARIENAVAKRHDILNTYEVNGPVRIHAKVTERLS